MPGRNRYRDGILEHLRKSAGQYVFISHANYYNEVARAVGQYLTEVVEVDVYLALNDADLAYSVAFGDHEGIVSHIESGIQTSSHMLTLIGNATRNSWWVPFEIGAATIARKSIGALILEEVEYLPSSCR
jgi:hypothetical protein